ncbi:hypothetical protein TCAL_03671 [Tigriopus californicus]|uniref:Dynactin subunit 4 n=1 Tax=Tigriopus californicus TaxID=6832 RepID=A0A553N7J1_TIGCA|nr:dynactin subunit 4-like [Tigriopus californicus]TRY61406.1 hypothetical protein TCAL_03671 [Tigriopus californicus]|eukprot:TCALIF_03671-PA protein Name:"Similar to DCTN4 Dynactin subunit 4 (Homo sapiens)" AED:0.18 eAED:0.19 QI:0/-1/0/1/-1/1/1/0/506
MASAAASIPCPFDEALLSRVQYTCSCGAPQTLSRLYFCRHCWAPRCGYCVSHEVDSHYCPHCLENMPSAEARLKKNRCGNCFDCPVCAHNLSTRATSTPVPRPDDPSQLVAKKVFYLVCAFCHWTSRDIGLPDQAVASGAWPDLEPHQAARLAQIQEHYRGLAQREKLEKESRRFLGRKLSYMQLSDKYGVSSAVARKRAGLPPAARSQLETASGAEAGRNAVELAPSPAVAIEEVEVLPEDLFTRPVVLSDVMALPARLSLLEQPPVMARDLYLKHKHLMIKRSQRCRECEHNLCKPEYNPSSIKFKIQLAAFYHVPEVVIYRVDPVRKPGTTVRFILKIVNPTQHPTQVEFLSMGQYQAARQSLEGAPAGPPEISPDKKPLGLIRHTMLVKAGEAQQIVANAQCLVPVGQVHLPQRDDAAEYDDTGPDIKNVVDDEKIVAWRKDNRVGVHFSARIDSDVTPNTPIMTSMALKFLYTNTISALEQKEAQTAEIMIPVHLNLGPAS